MSWIHQCHAVLLSKATGKPVKLVFTKEEHLAAFTLRPATRIHARVGMKKDGTVTAVSGAWLVGTGYYSMTTQAQVAVGCGEVQIAFQCPNWDLKARCGLHQPERLGCCKRLRRSGVEVRAHPAFVSCHGEGRG